MDLIQLYFSRWGSWECRWGLNPEGLTLDPPLVWRGSLFAQELCAWSGHSFLPSGLACAQRTGAPEVPARAGKGAGVARTCCASGGEPGGRQRRPPSGAAPNQRAGRLPLGERRRRRPSEGKKIANLFAASRLLPAPPPLRAWEGEGRKARRAAAGGQRFGSFPVPCIGRHAGAHLTRGRPRSGQRGVGLRFTGAWWDRATGGREVRSPGPVVERLRRAPLERSSPGVALLPCKRPRLLGSGLKSE